MDYTKISDEDTIIHTAMWNISYHNNTHNYSTNMSSHTLIAYFPAGFKTICFILAAVITIFNSIVVMAYILSSRVRRTMSLFMLNLAVVDLQNGCVSLPLLLLFPRTELEQSPQMGSALCVLLVMWPKVLFIVAYQSVLVVTVERFICVAKPYTYRKLLRRWRCFLVIVVLWLYAAIFCLLPTFGYERITVKGILYMCNGVYQQGVVYLHVFLYVVLGIPLLVIVILYALMYRIARKHTLMIQKIQSTCVLTGDDKKKKTQIVQTSKAAKTAGLLTAFYLICWLPFLILFQVSELCKLGQCSDTMTQENLQRATPPTVFLAFLGCAINPVIYIFRTGSIRMACRSLFVRWELMKETKRSSSPYASPTSTRSSVCVTTLKQDNKGYSVVSLHSIF